MIDFKKVNGLQKELILSQWLANFSTINQKSVEEAEEYCKKYIKLRKTFQRIEDNE